jgi:eukaryotic-like serine/threonine-protein kinase
VPQDAATREACAAVTALARTLGALHRVPGAFIAKEGNRRRLVRGLGAADSIRRSSPEDRARARDQWEVAARPAQRVDGAARSPDRPAAGPGPGNASQYYSGAVGNATLASRVPRQDENDTRVERVDPLLGVVLGGKYRLEVRIASGGFGAIYQASHVETGIELAVKVVHARHASDPGIVARFQREGDALTALRSQHTVTAYELGETEEGILYMAMELLRGATLYERFRDDGPLSWRRMAQIAIGVCHSLAEAHALGVVHRDLKPTNIYLERRGSDRDFVKVLDFGIAKILQGSQFDSSDLTSAGLMIGTLDYMSPEQMVGGEISGASDLYTLGIVMYEMIAGKRPFPAAPSAASVLAAMLKPPTRLGSVATVPAELDRIVMRCLERDAADRYQTADELAAELSRLLDSREGRPRSFEDDDATQIAAKRLISATYLAADPVPPLPATPAAPPSAFPATPAPSSASSPPSFTGDSVATRQLPVPPLPEVTQARPSPAVPRTMQLPATPRRVSTPPSSPPPLPGVASPPSSPPAIPSSLSGSRSAPQVIPPSLPGSRSSPQVIPPASSSPQEPMIPPAMSFLPLPPGGLPSTPRPDAGSLPTTPISTLRGVALPQRDSTRTAVDATVMDAPSARTRFDPARIAQRDAMVRRLLWSCILVIAVVVGVVLAMRL